jgi:hypothetical protein
MLPKRSEREIKLIALGASIISLLTTLCVWSRFDPNAGLAFEERWSWIPALNVDYHLGVDGLSMTMVLLTAIVTPLALLAHWKQDPEREIVLHPVPAAGNRHVRRVYRAEFLSLVHLLGARVDPDVLPHQDLGSGRPHVRVVQVSSLHAGGQRRDAPGVYVHLSGDKLLRFPRVASEGVFRGIDAQRSKSL